MRLRPYRAPTRNACREYIAFLRWQASHDAPSTAGAGQVSGRQAAAGLGWHFSFLEHFTEADVRASRDAAGMEVKIAEASVGRERRPALWQHPPVNGESLAEFHVPIPAGLHDLRLRFAIGVREGTRAADQLVAFRVRVDGWQVWSRAAWPATWQAFELTCRFRPVMSCAWPSPPMPWAAINGPGPCGESRN